MLLERLFEDTIRLLLVCLILLLLFERLWLRLLCGYLYKRCIFRSDYQSHLKKFWGGAFGGVLQKRGTPFCKSWVPRGVRIRSSATDRSINQKKGALAHKISIIFKSADHNNIWPCLPAVSSEFGGRGTIEKKFYLFVIYIPSAN